MAVVLDQAVIDHTNIAAPLTVPRDLVPAMTFSAPLNNSLDAEGQGSTIPTFTRATIATYLDRDTGLVTDVASGKARYENQGMLIEGQRENLMLQSEDLTTTWAKTACSIDGNSTSLPDGNTGIVNDLVGDNEAAAHYLRQDYTRTSAATQGFSMYAKAGSKNWVWVQISSGGNSLRQWFDLNAEAVGSSVPVGSGMTVVAGSPAIAAVPGAAGWYRCSVAVDTEAITATPVLIGPSDANAGLVSTDDGSTVSAYFWGIQIEDNVQFVSSYIPTTTGAVMRNQDVLTYPASGNIVSSSAGSLIIVADTKNIALLQLAIDTRSAGGQNGVAMFISTSAEAVGRTAAGAIQATITVAAPLFVVDVLSELAITWETNSVNQYIDGTAGTPDTSAANPGTHTAIQIGANQGDGQSWFGHVQSIVIMNIAHTAFDVGRL